MPAPALGFQWEGLTLPVPSTDPPSGAVWPPVPPDLVAGASLLVPYNILAPAPLPFLARMNWERFLPSLGGSLAQNPQPAPSCTSQSSPEPPAQSWGIPKIPAKGEE